MGDMSNFANEDHAMLTGVVLGTLLKSGISALPVWDNEGFHTPCIRILIEAGHLEPLEVLIEIRP